PAAAQSTSRSAAVTRCAGAVCVLRPRSSQPSPPPLRYDRRYGARRRGWRSRHPQVGKPHRTPRPVNETPPSPPASIIHPPPSPPPPTPPPAPPPHPPIEPRALSSRLTHCKKDYSPPEGCSCTPRSRRLQDVAAFARAKIR